MAPVFENLDRLRNPNIIQWLKESKKSIRVDPRELVRNRRAQLAWPSQTGEAGVDPHYLSGRHGQSGHFSSTKKKLKIPASTLKRPKMPAKEISRPCMDCKDAEIVFTVRKRQLCRYAMTKSIIIFDHPALTLD